MNTYFTEDHEWITIDGDIATVGITEHAQEQLGDIVFVELPDIDEDYDKGDDIAVVESVKAAGDIHNPLPGRVIEVNGQLEEEPALVNSHAEANGWIYKIQLSEALNPNDFMDAAAYQAYINC